MNDYSTVSPAEVGVMSGSIGAAMGYVLAPRKYNLEQIFTQKPDTFEKTFSPMMIQKSADIQKQAYNDIVSARKSLNSIKDENVVNKKLAELIGSQKYTQAYKALKSLIPKARVQSAIILGLLGTMFGILGKIIVGDE